MPVCVHAIQPLLSIHFNSSTVHFTSVHFLRLLLSHLIEWKSESAGEVTDTSFSLFPCLLWFMCMVSALFTNQYVALWWFTWILSKWILNSSVIHLAECWADVGFLQILSHSRGCQIHHKCRLLMLALFLLQMGPRSLGHTHTHTQGPKQSPPSQPSIPIFSLDTVQMPLRSVLWKKGICGSWVFDSSHQALTGPHSWRRDFVMGLCPLTHSAVPLRPSVSRPIHSSGAPETLLSVYCRITAFVCFKCDSCFIHLPSVEAMR